MSVRTVWRTCLVVREEEKESMESHEEGLDWVLTGREVLVLGVLLEVLLPGRGADDFSSTG